MSKTAFVFPGQGAQKPGMGKDFYDNSETARNIFRRASGILKLDMEKICFEKNELLDQTEYTQPALAVTCLAMLRAVMERGYRPDITAGLSLGEYCAIAAAGGMSDMDVIRTVRQRGILMQEAVPEGKGAMAAILGMTGDAIEKVVCPMDGVSIANYNCPGQIVITGRTEAVAQASEILLKSGAKRAVPLNVSGPFHSPMLTDAGKKLGSVLEKVTFHRLHIPYVTNVTAESVADIIKTKALLEAQVAASVRWQQSVEHMLALGIDTFVEIGPGRTLAGFIRKIDRNVRVLNLSSWEDMDVLSCLEQRDE